MTRNRASAKAAGRNWESAIVDELRVAGWVHAERGGESITGVPGIVIVGADPMKGVEDDEADPAV